MALSLSVVIVTKDRFKDMHSCISCIAAQTELPDTLIIVDSSSEKGLDEIVMKLLKGSPIHIEYIRSKPGITHQRNQGIRANQNDLVLFLDDDVVLEDNYISEIKKVFIQENGGDIVGATGRIMNDKKKLPFLSNLIRYLTFLDYNGKGELRRSGANNRMMNVDHSRELPVGWLSGCNMCYRSDVLSREMCDENFEVGGGEDVDLSCRVGKHGTLIYRPAARLLHNESVAARPKFNIHKYRKMLYHYYKFKKNLPQTFLNILAFHISLIGYIIQALFLTRNMEAVQGTLKGIYTIWFKIKDYKQIRKYIV